MKKELNKGVTLIALIITIIVLLILAGITLAMVVGDNGIIAKAGTAKKVTDESQSAELNQLDDYENKIDEYTDRGNKEIRTELFASSSEYGTGGTNITLSDAYTNYKKIEIFYRGNVNDDYVVPYQSTIVNVSDLANQDNYVTICIYGRDSNAWYISSSAYMFNNTTLEFKGTERRCMTNGSMYYGDQVGILKIEGIN